MKLDALIRALRQVGNEYLKNHPQDGYFAFIKKYRHGNHEAAGKVSQIGLTVDKSVPPKIQELQLLTELHEIFIKIPSSNELSKNVKEKLVEYESFKNIEDYFPSNSSKSDPTVTDMREAIFKMMTLTGVDNTLRQHAEMKK